MRRRPTKTTHSTPPIVVSSAHRIRRRSTHPRPARSAPIRRDDATTIRRKYALSIPSSWPRSTRFSSPLAASQIRAVLSSAAVTMRLPSGENDALFTPSLWPRSTRISPPLTAFQTALVWSNEAVTMRPPSGENDAPSPHDRTAARSGTQIFPPARRIPHPHPSTIGGGRACGCHLARTTR